MSQAERNTRDELRSKLVNLCRFLASDECEPWQRDPLLDEVNQIGRILSPSADHALFDRYAPAILACNYRPSLAVA